MLPAIIDSLISASGMSVVMTPLTKLAGEQIGSGIV